MKQFYFLFTILFILLRSSNSNAQISGIVFRDFNANGVKDNTATFNEPFVAGVTVKAFNAANVQIGATKTTDAAGAFSFTAVEIPATTKIRIEFSGLDIGDNAAFKGTDNGTSVQFFNAPSTMANFAVSNTKEYSSTTNPTVFIPMMVSGDPTNTTNNKGLLSFPYSNSGAAASATTLTKSQIGSTWGLAYDKLRQKVYLGSFLKRHVGLREGLAANNLGAIYSANDDGTSFGLWANIANPGTVGTNAARGVNVAPAAQNRDETTYGLIGKVGLGGVEIDDDMANIYTINLNTKELIKIAINTNGTSGIQTTFAIPTSGVTGVAATDLRPFALKCYNNKVYVGVVFSAQSTGTLSELNAAVYEFNPSTGLFNAIPVYQLPLNYARGKIYSSLVATSANWRPWSDSWASVLSDGGTFRFNPQPMLSDIEFDVDGAMILSFMDRFGHQVGSANYENPTLGDNTLYGKYVAGELLKVCIASGTYNLCANNFSNNQGPNSGEFYLDEVNVYTNGTGKHDEHVMGALGLLAGSNQVMVSTFDPIDAVQAGADHFNEGGVVRYNNTTGDAGLNDRYLTYLNTDAGSLRKGNGLGDIEFALDMQPIQIGNRIWNDLNADGIQDANETTSPVAAGTVITIRSPGLNGTYGDIDDQTSTTTTDAAGNYYFSALSFSDNRKPSTWVGIGNSILPGYDYRIETAAVGGFYVTLTNVGGNSVDNIDNDATSNGGIAVIAFNTANVNHNFDFGFAPNSTLPVKVTSFTAAPQNNKVALVWHVENQQGIKKYEVEHSTNGRTFTKIDEVPANSLSVSSYSVIHNNPVSGNNYYRIHITETDGKESYTEIQKVNFAKVVGVTVYPNPVKDILSIAISQSLLNKPAVISLLTMGGKKIYQKQSKALSQTEIIKLPSIANGKYILRIESNQDVITKEIAILK